MSFTDVFIRRPVLATVLSLLVVLLGLRAYSSLSIREYPDITYPVISVTTLHPGASAELVQGFITRTLERAVAEAEGIDYLEAKSSEGMSEIQVHLRAGYDVDDAFADIGAKVQQQRKDLPREAEDPVLGKSRVHGPESLMYLSFTSEELEREQITDYLDRVVRPKLSTIEGMGRVNIFGGRDFAMRVWLDPVRLAAFGLSAADVREAIDRANVQSAGGTLRSDFLQLFMDPRTGLESAEGFAALVVKREGGTVVRLGDVGRVELGAENYDEQVSDKGRAAVFIGVSPAVTANPLEVGARVRALVPQMLAQFPPGLHGEVVWDATTTIEKSIEEVIKTLIEASLIVIVVIFLFLGDFRSVLVPVVTIPLSLVGVASVMLALGFSINLLTLLALVLSIGLVVDDAIVVVENIQRHMEEGMDAMSAALQGAREIAFPVLVMTLTLAAVYAPIGFLGGLTGKLFVEFAFTLVGSVIISGAAALTLSPMMCSRILRHEDTPHGLVAFLERAFEALKRRYRGLLRLTLANRAPVVLVAATVFVSIFFLLRAIPRELAPLEDTGEVYLMGEAPLAATVEYMEPFVAQVDAMLAAVPEHRRRFVVTARGGAQNSFFGMLMLVPWEQRERSAPQVRQELQQRFADVSGLRINAFNIPSVPGASADLPIKFVVSSTGSYELVYRVAEEIEQKARRSGLFVFASSSLEFDKPQLRLEIDRDKAAQLGIDVRDIAVTLGSFLGEFESGRFSLESRSYKIILQLERSERLNPGLLETYFLRNRDGEMVPLSAVASWSRRNSPNLLSEHQQLNSATIGAMPAPGVSLGQGVNWFETEARALLPAGFSADHVGQSRQFLEEGDVLLFTFVFSVIVIFLVLSAQFESFSDPLTVLVSVPLSVCGALIPLALGMATMNIYTQIGLLTLIGLISKHGILIVDFANRLREQRAFGVIEAVVEAAAVRLRPILMTTAAMVCGVIPLLFASGAGAQARVSIGIVVFFGMLIGTLFTLFVVPTVYTFVAHRQQIAMPGADEAAVAAGGRAD